MALSNPAMKFRNTRTDEANLKYYQLSERKLILRFKHYVIKI